MLTDNPLATISGLKTNIKWIELYLDVNIFIMKEK